MRKEGRKGQREKKQRQSKGYNQNEKMITLPRTQVAEAHTLYNSWYMDKYIQDPVTNPSH